jgi:DNA-binding transcriptional regulator YhcF (GntR family)
VLERRKRTADPQKREQFARRLREMIAELKADGVRLDDIRRELNLVMKGLDV